MMDRETLKKEHCPSATLSHSDYLEIEMWPVAHTSIQLPWNIVIAACVLHVPPIATAYIQQNQ